MKQTGGLGMFLEKNEELDEVKVSFLHPSGPSKSFSYPRNADILWVSVMDVLMKVDPATPTGTTYVLPESDGCQTNEVFSSLK